MGQMDDEQAACGQLTLSDFRKWCSTVLQTFSNYPITMNKNSNNIQIS